MGGWVGACAYACGDMGRSGCTDHECGHVHAGRCWAMSHATVRCSATLCTRSTIFSTRSVPCTPRRCWTSCSQHCPTRIGPPTTSHCWHDSASRQPSRSAIVLLSHLHCTGTAELAKDVLVWVQVPAAMGPDGRPVCKYGEGCKFWAMGACKNYHPPKLCKFGKGCVYYARGTCKNYHPPAHKVQELYCPEVPQWKV